MALVAIAGIATGAYLFSRILSKKKQQESRTREERQAGPVVPNRNKVTAPPQGIKSSRYLGKGQYGMPKWEVTFEDGTIEYKYTHTDPRLLLTT